MTKLEWIAPEELERPGLVWDQRTFALVDYGPYKPDDRYRLFTVMRAWNEIHTPSFIAEEEAVRKRYPVRRVCVLGPEFPGGVTICQSTLPPERLPS